MIFKVAWYDQNEVVSEEANIEAPNRDEAVKLAYTRHNGNPPAPMLYLEEVK